MLSCAARRWARALYPLLLGPLVLAGCSGGDSRPVRAMCDYLSVDEVSQAIAPFYANATEPHGLLECDYLFAYPFFGTSSEGRIVVAVSADRRDLHREVGKENKVDVPGEEEKAALLAKDGFELQVLVKGYHVDTKIVADLAVTPEQRRQIHFRLYRKILPRLGISAP